MQETDFFKDFPLLSEQEIKQKINFLLQGKPYNLQPEEALLEEIFVQQLYLEQTDTIPHFSCQKQTQEVIFIEKDFDTKVKQFSENDIFILKISSEEELKNIELLPLNKTYYVWLDFFVNNIQILDFNRFIFLFDPISKLTQTGNFYKNKIEDFTLWKALFKQSKVLLINTKVFADAGAINVQQVAYLFSILSDYLSEIELLEPHIVKVYALVGQQPNLSFDLAKLVAIRWVFSSIFKEYKNIDLQIFTQPSEYYFSNRISQREFNGIKYQWALQSAVLGHSDYVITSESVFYEINQVEILNILKDFNKKEITNSLFLKHITKQIAQKSLLLWKDIQKGGGYLSLLKKHIIQKKIKEKHQKRKSIFQFYEEKTNVKNRIKTLIEPISPKTLDILYETEL